MRRDTFFGMVFFTDEHDLFQDADMIQRLLLADRPHGPHRKVCLVLKTAIDSPPQNGWPAIYEALRGQPHDRIRDFSGWNRQVGFFEIALRNRPISRKVMQRRLISAWRIDV